MTEAIFPLLGTAFVILIALPCSALIAKAGLMIVEHEKVSGRLHSLDLRYILLIATSIVPIAWFLSAGLHQIESGKLTLACLFDHNAALCFEPGFFALTLIFVVIHLGTATLRHNRRPRISTSTHADALTQRVERLILANASLQPLHGRIRITDEHDFALGTHGLLKPVVIIGSSFADRISHDMLASALAHENEHVRSLDPLRYLLLKLALAVNPLGRFLLGSHVSRWHAAQEAHCDREAVIRGASPLSLADAIIRAARPSTQEAVALGARDTTVLKFRIQMLLAFSEQNPTRCCRREIPAIPMILILLIFTLILPHQTSTAALDAIHTGSEHILTYFLH